MNKPFIFASNALFLRLDYSLPLAVRKSLTTAGNTLKSNYFIIIAWISFTKKHPH